MTQFTPSLPLSLACVIGTAELHGPTHRLLIQIALSFTLTQIEAVFYVHDSDESSR